MDLERLRDRMVKEQIAARGMGDKTVLAALRRVPRHKFVPEDLRHSAYADCPLSIGEGQTISQPYMVALMTQCLKLDKSKRVFEIGTGSGYQTAVLAELAKKVISIERIAVLADLARERLSKLHYPNVEVLCGDGSSGEECPEQFDAILMTAGSPAAPKQLFPHLSEGGRLVAPVGDRRSQVLKVFTKTGDRVEEESVCGCTFVPLIGKYGWPRD